MRARVHGLAGHRRRVLPALVVGPQALRQRLWLARGGYGLVVVVLVVGHGHFVGAGAVLGEVVSLTAGALGFTSLADSAGDAFRGCAGVSDGAAEGDCVAGIAGVADAPEFK